MFDPTRPSLRSRLARKAPLGAFWMSLGSATVVEIAAGAKPDAIVIDAQHGLFDRQTLEHAVGAASRHAGVLVRTSENTPMAIGQALDSGAEGVIVPLIELDHQAADAVAAARFPPQGHRSAGGVRPLAGDFAQYCALANAHTVVGVMIETQRGVRNAAARGCARRSASRTGLPDRIGGLPGRAPAVRDIYRPCRGRDCAPPRRL
jgi:2-keto-3-deoxy-L-rhamnonate aldolase RhmA